MRSVLIHSFWLRPLGQNRALTGFDGKNAIDEISTKTVALAMLEYLVTRTRYCYPCNLGLFSQEGTTTTHLSLRAAMDNEVVYKEGILNRATTRQESVPTIESIATKYSITPL